MDRVCMDGCEAPVQLCLSQTTAERPHNVLLLTLLPADFHKPEPPSPAFRRLFRKQQLAGSACTLNPPDRAPFTFFASPSVPKGNGAITPLDFHYDPLLPLLFWAHWPVHAH